MEDLPESDPHRDEYISIYRDMAEALANCQQEEGFWTRSLLDVGHAPGYETSSTAFFLYGYLWGMNNGFLDRNDYGHVVNRALNRPMIMSIGYLYRIENNIAVLPAKKAPDYFSKYGKDLSYVSLRRNANTTWYIFFNHESDLFHVRYISNNHIIAKYL